MTFIKGDIVDVRGHVVDECWHGPAVLTDGAAEHLTVDVEVMGVCKQGFAVGLTDIFARIFG